MSNNTYILCFEHKDKVYFFLILPVVADYCHWKWFEILKKFERYISLEANLNKALYYLGKSF